MAYYKAKCQNKDCKKEFLIDGNDLGKNMVCPHCQQVSVTPGLDGKIEEAGNIPVAEPEERKG